MKNTESFHMKPTRDLIKRVDVDKDANYLMECLNNIMHPGFVEDVKFILSYFPRCGYLNRRHIRKQNPNATCVLTRAEWEMSYDRHVRKGEEPLEIFRVDENEEVIIKPIYVYDVSQTEGEELPYYDYFDLMFRKDVPQYENLVEALIQSCPAPISFEDLSKTTYGGYYSPRENRIVIRKNMSQAFTINSIIHEMAHQRLHKSVPVNNGQRRKHEVQAESVAYIVCQNYGINTSSLSFDYIARYSSSEHLTEFKSSFGLIKETAFSMIQEIDEKFLEKEQAVELKLDSKTDTMENKTISQSKQSTKRRRGEHEQSR